MKNTFYYFILVATFISCAEKNVPENGGNNGNNNNPQDTIVESMPKYLIESYQKFSWVNEETSYKDVLGNSTKQIYERESQAKYKKSYSVYSNDALTQTISYRNEGLTEYGTFSYHQDNSIIGIPYDTTYYLDEERTLPKEIRYPLSYSLYTYDSKNRVLTLNSYYRQQYTQKIETSYSYNGMIRYTDGKAYDNNGNIYYSNRDTTEFVNEKYDRIRKNSSWTFYYDNATIEKCHQVSEYEWGEYGYTDVKSEITYYYKDGNISKTLSHGTYNWSDEFTQIGTSESYTGNGVKLYVQDIHNYYVR